MINVKQAVANRLGIGVDKIVVNRVGGWLTDSVNPSILETNPDKKANPLDWNPPFPQQPQHFYCEVSVSSGTTVGSSFRMEFSAEDLSEIQAATPLSSPTLPANPVSQ